MFHACFSAQIACVYIYKTQYICMAALHAEEATSHWMQLDWTENLCRKFKYTFFEDEKQLWWTMQTKKKKNRCFIRLLIILGTMHVLACVFYLCFLLSCDLFICLWLVWFISWTRGKVSNKTCISNSTSSLSRMHFLWPWNVLMVKHEVTTPLCLFLAS